MGRFRAEPRLPEQGASNCCAQSRTMIQCTGAWTGHLRAWASYGERPRGLKGAESCDTQRGRFSHQERQARLHRPAAQLDRRARCANERHRPACPQAPARARARVRTRRARARALPTRPRGVASTRPLLFPAINPPMAGSTHQRLPQKPERRGQIEAHQRGACKLKRQRRRKTRLFAARGK